MWYATPLLRQPTFPYLYATKSSALPFLLSTQQGLTRDPHLAEIHSEEVFLMLVMSPNLSQALIKTQRSPGCLLDRLVYNCSCQHQGQSLTDTSYLCCSINAIECYARGLLGEDNDLRKSFEQSFYVDNCLQNFPSANAAKCFGYNMRSRLATGAFEIRQWTSNMPSIMKHLHIILDHTPLIYGYVTALVIHKSLHWVCARPLTPLILQLPL